MSLLSAVATALDSFAAFCSELSLEDGAAFELWPFQRVMLVDYFDGAIETTLIIPKKNGKTTLLAALALYHMVVTDNAECIIVAASREQAELVLRQARMFIRQSPALQRLMEIQQRSVRSKVDEGRIRVLASDADTADGTIPTLAIVDELHRHRSAELHGVLRNGLGPRHGQIITISTAASTFDSPLGKLRAIFHDHPSFIRDGKHNYARSANSAFHEWCLSPEDDTDDLEVVKLANPGPWQTIEALRIRKDSEMASEAEWLRYACGIWTEAEEPWLDPSQWDGLASEGLAIPDGSEIWLAVKMRGQTAAVVTLTKTEEHLDAEAAIWNDEVTFAEVEGTVRDLCARFRVKSVLFEGRSFGRSAELLETEGYPMLEFPMTTPERLSMTSASLQRVIESRQLRHSGAQDFRSHVLAGTWKQDERGRRLVEDPHSRRPIDALHALASAVHVAGAPQKTGEVMVAWR